MPLLGGGLLGMGGGLSGSFFSGVGGAVSDLFSADALKFKEKGDLIEAQQYRVAAQYALLNKQYTIESTDIKEYQLSRKAYQTTGDMAADVAANNFEMSGSAIDEYRDSSAQAALEKGVASQQGLIEEAGYQEQADSYNLMAQAKDEAAAADAKAAQGATWGAIIKGVGAIASIL